MSPLLLFLPPVDKAVRVKWGNIKASSLLPFIFHFHHIRIHNPMRNASSSHTGSANRIRSVGLGSWDGARMQRIHAHLCG